MLDRFSLEGRTALVTGGAQGIGRALSLAFGEVGVSVVVGDLNADMAAAVAKEIVAAGGVARGIRIDVADEESVVTAFAELDGALDILVNNAGIYPMHTIEGHPLSLFDTVMRVNLGGTFLCTREAASPMAARGGGSIVNLASIAAARAGQPAVSAYGASKGAIAAFTRNAALELADANIRVNAIAPGFIKTEGTSDLLQDFMVDLVLQHQAVKRIGAPEDLCGMVLALAGDGTSFVTGQTIFVDGGFLLV
jgi:NAD(P)-dependent dehydrogenase (short-subunit alcohol dehydrogenase family)